MTTQQRRAVFAHINDCTDYNARNRICLRLGTLFDCRVSVFTFPVGPHEPVLEASGHLVDSLDALRQPPTVRWQPQPEAGERFVLLNVAPRDQDGVNGSQFVVCEAAGGARIVSTYNHGYSLALANKLGLIHSTYVLDTTQVVGYLVREQFLLPSSAQRVINSQFRSFELAPLVMYCWARHEEIDVPYVGMVDSPDLPALGRQVWFIDNFGGQPTNAKTTLLPEDVGFDPGKTIDTKVGPLVCYSCLSEVPLGESGLVIGSSGYGSKRLLEIVVKGGSAADTFGLKVGSEL